MLNSKMNEEASSDESDLSKKLYEATLDEKQYRCGSDTFSTAILYRDTVTGAAKIHPFDPKQIDEDDILNFFKYYKCYDIIHQNTKLVVLDTRLTLKKALTAMMDQGVRACPLWNSDNKSYVGMTTINDFIRILQKNYQGPDIPMEAFETTTLAQWQDTIHSNK